MQGVFDPAKKRIKANWKNPFGGFHDFRRKSHGKSTRKARYDTHPKQITGKSKIQNRAELFKKNKKRLRKKRRRRLKKGGGRERDAKLWGGDASKERRHLQGAAGRGASRKRTRGGLGSSKFPGRGGGPRSRHSLELIQYFSGNPAQSKKRSFSA